jgi:hypothetical protein
MKKKGTIGAAAFLAIAAVVGVSLQTGPKQDAGGRGDQSSAIKRSRPALAKNVHHEYLPGCSSLEEQLEGFLEIKDLIPPGQCIKPGEPPVNNSPREMTQKTSQLKFLIALLPDPVHTHFSVLFDQFAVAIQEGAQDEKYDFDTSWLPWDDDDSHYSRFADEKASDLEKEERENQPGIILFRKTIDCQESARTRLSDCKENAGASAKNDESALSISYREGLVVFVVGEEATQGIHRAQFRNALQWIETLQSKTAPPIGRLAILGPTFSGSFPSLTQALHDLNITEQSDLPTTPDGQPLAIFSGSVSGSDEAKAFQKLLSPQVTFHSFVQSDSEIMRRFCNYIMEEQSGFEPSRVAIISEDETAYGSEPAPPVKPGNGSEPAPDSPDKEKKHVDKDCQNRALRLYYPRDISALRGAYQTTSLFDVGTSPQPVETQRRSLPTDLADPSGKVRDTIHSYGGTQTPLNQEAFLMEIVAALRELHARYVFLRSSNTLDQVFLTNFLRRSYPDARIVIVGSDLMFIRERGVTGLSGAMTLSTYPLFPLERDWTEHQSLPAADRAFSSDTAEGTYVAFRLLLNDKSLNDGDPDSYRCRVLEKRKEPDRCRAPEKGNEKNKDDKCKEDDGIFVPRVSCTKDPPIPDYSAPFWTLRKQCGEMEYEKDAKDAANQQCAYLGPATWLSVIGGNRFWPMASLTSDTPKASSVDHTTTGRMDKRKTEPGGRPEIPSEMKVFLLALVVFSVFHALCCWSGSYTAKPAFRAHFASTGEWRHTFLVFSGSCCVAFLAMVAGWGCGVFAIPPSGLTYPWFAFGCASIVCLMAWVAILGHNCTAWKLSQDISSSPDQPRMTQRDFTTRNYRASGLFVAAIFLFCVSFVVPLEWKLLTENRVLTYWRAMHLASGVSPIVPILLVFAGLYLSFWFTLHGLALFGPDRPCLPPKERLALKDASGENRDFLRMFSQEDAAAKIERAAMPFNKNYPDQKDLLAEENYPFLFGIFLFLLFLRGAYAIGGRVPVRSLGAQNYASIFLVCLDLCCTLAIVEAWRLCQTWEQLRRLLAFLDRLPLRRTLASLRGFSWGGVWKMSGNVLEVRYKVISRQMECMNHTIASLEELLKKPPDLGDIRATRTSIAALLCMRRAGVKFAKWYSINYDISRAGDLSSFTKFQKSIASASGTLLAKLLVPAWRMEEGSLIVACENDETKEAAPHHPPLADDEHIRNAEEFVCLNYLGFIQNILGRLRTMTLTIMLLLIIATVATSTYPFDPQQALSAILIILFVIVGAVIVRVYADMHRDATLSHVTNTTPGELGTEFWFKIVGFGFAPLIGLLARIFPSMTDFIFSWLQPGISSLK